VRGARLPTASQSSRDPGLEERVLRRRAVDLTLCRAGPTIRPFCVIPNQP
jgi:hypothetical protein